MNMIRILAFIVLISKSSYCFVPRNAILDYSTLTDSTAYSNRQPSEIEHQQKQQQTSPFELNDRPVYDPGVGECCI